MLGRKPLGTVAYMGGVPSVLEPFCWAWGQMVQCTEEQLGSVTHYVHYDHATFSDHAPARNNLTTAFLGDWLIQMDTDHRFDPDIVARLVTLANQHNLDVLSAVYQQKGHPHVPVLYQWNGDLLQPLASYPKEASILQIASAGAGCLFIRRSVFDRFAEAYPGVGAFDRIHPYSEDHSFFLRCKEQGIKCWAAMKVHSEHLRIVGVTPDDLDWNALRQSELRPVEGYA